MFLVDTPTFTTAPSGRLVFTFSPPVSGFSFLIRNLNNQPFFNGTITVTSDSENITATVPAQADGDINFVGWFQAERTVTSVSLAPLRIKQSSPSVGLGLELALDELRVYTPRAPSISFSLDHCETANASYPNGSALAATFIAAAVDAGFVASLQNFDTQAAPSSAPSSILFPAGSAFNGSVDVSIVNATLESRTCKSLCAVRVACLRRRKRTDTGISRHELRTTFSLVCTA
jgi:hypothetical protein